ncbi:WbqC family protein [Rhizobium sp. YTU87027]|uniref:WbqC family protein n=1 Tax=Rhizobium sp. YTU87027 TaxID=3417741 RepID=UPI003D68FA4C
MKKIAILQSNYIPWKGYFDIIAAVDEFILYDDMQYTRRDWRNRNQIKTPQGLAWLTVPVKVRGKYHQTIRQTEIDGREWATAHWKSLVLNYKKAPHFDEVAAFLEPFYFSNDYDLLSPLNRALLESICRYLGIMTRITNSWDYELVDGKSERLADLCVQAGGTEYISGPAARAYIDEKVFSERGLKLAWFDYQGYPEYPQQWGEFVHAVSILDLLFNCGKDSSAFMKYAKTRSRDI